MYFTYLLFSRGKSHFQREVFSITCGSIRTLNASRTCSGSERYVYEEVRIFELTICGWRIKQPQRGRTLVEIQVRTVSPAWPLGPPRWPLPFRNICTKNIFHKHLHISAWCLIVPVLERTGFWWGLGEVQEAGGTTAPIREKIKILSPKTVNCPL